MSLSAEPQQDPYYFISYSRQEVTFADSFSRALAKQGINSWMDFRNLIPGHSWQHQLEQGMQGANAVLLVVSKASMVSQSVQDEWTTSLALGKRIVLIIFEPCKLDADLAGLEWVDFTGNFDKAMTELASLLAQPPQTVTSMPPQRWIRLPGVARKFMMLNILMVIMSVIGLCLILFMVPNTKVYLDTTGIQDSVTNFRCLLGMFVWLPAIFIFAMLPLQFLRRTHNAQTIRNILIVLLAASLLLWIIQGLATLGVNFLGTDVSISSYIGCGLPSLLITVITCIYLNRLLVSEEMYRWSGPTGAVIRNSSPDLTGHTSNGPSMRVAVEFAPQDRIFAQELKASILKAGHIFTDDLQDADIVMPLLSAYKTSSICNPETTRVIPILIQSCNVDKSLSRTQWVDLRYGKASMDAVANLLDEPHELLRLLGVLPVRTTILPNRIKWLVIVISFFLNVLLVINLIIGWSAILTYDVYDVDTLGPFFILVPILGLYLLRRYIVYRKLRYLSFLSYWWAVGFALILAVFFIGFWDLTTGSPLLLVPLLMLQKEVKMWLPSPVKSHPYT